MQSIGCTKRYILIINFVKDYHFHNYDYDYYYSAIDHVLKTTLSLYMESSHESERQVPLPTNEEVLICTERTTIEEVTLLWKRAFDDPGNKRIFCLVNADLLVYQVCDKSLHELQHLSQNKKGRFDFL